MKKTKRKKGYAISYLTPPSKYKKRVVGGKRFRTKRTALEYVREGQRKAPQFKRRVVKAIGRRRTTY